MDSNFGDNSTVVGSTSNGFRKEQARDDISLKSRPNHSHGAGLDKKKIGNDFVTSADQALVDRPFFVTIGHDGLIGALQKLDEQLVKVRRFILPV